MLKSMTNEAVVGWYGAPYRLFDTLMFFPNILNTAVFPVLSRFVQSSREHVDHTARWILNLTLFVAIPVAVLLVVLADSIIPLIFGAQYHNSVVLLQILSVSLLLIYVDFVFNTVLVSHDMQRKIVVVSAIATVVNIGVNLFLIRYFQEHHGNGAIGAAIATAITEASVMAMFMYLLPKGVFGHENIIVLAKTIACGVVMWGAIWLVQQSAIGWVFSAIVGVAVYLLMLFSLRAISQHEWQFIASLLSFRKQATVTISN
jgi:O-antigen/teichoic acid export membrane protein